MKNAMFKFSAALTLAAAATSAAYAGGFMLTEQSVAGLGRAYASWVTICPPSGTTRPVWFFCPARSFRWVP